MGHTTLGGRELLCKERAEGEAVKLLVSPAWAPWLCQILHSRTGCWELKLLCVLGVRWEVTGLLYLWLDFM